MAVKAKKAKPRAPKFIGCTLRRLPASKQVKAARAAIKENPANAPVAAALTALAMPLASKDAVSPAQKLAVLTSKYWGQGGVRLTVSFMEKTVAALQDKVLAAVNQWNRYANVEFVRVDGGGQVRISRGRGGYWSYLGTDVLQVPKSQPTMNLEGFVLATSDAEYDRVPPHEAGHTLGAPHEHLRAALIRRLDREKVISYFMRTQGWGREDVIAQTLTALEESQLMATDVADPRSIMTYFFDGSLTLDGQPIEGGSRIDATDVEFIGRLYPKPSAPPPPPPPPVSADPSVQWWGGVPPTRLVIGGKEWAPK